MFVTALANLKHKPYIASSMLNVKLQLASAEQKLHTIIGVFSSLFLQLLAR